MFDADGNRFIDFINSWGPMIMGHSYPPVLHAITEQVQKSISFGTPTELEIQVAELIRKMAPNIDRVRMVNSGTEACMSAIRLARGFTGRNKIIKCEGCYHGHADAFLVKAGSGVATLEIQTVPGVTANVSLDTLTVPYNDLDAVSTVIKKYKSEIAALIIEPVAGNMGCIPPVPGYLQGLRKICNEEGIVLIFDEVMTGFRLSGGGAQELYHIDADLITFGKVIGAGMPVGAFGGKEEIMNHIAPIGKVYQAGTLSGNPVAMTAGYTLLNILNKQPSIYNQLEEKTNYLRKGLEKILNMAERPFVINQVGSMISVHFTNKPVIDFESASAADNQFFGQFFHAMLRRGVYLPPSAFETWFICNALTKEDLDYTIEAAKDSIEEIVSRKDAK